MSDSQIIAVSPQIMAPNVENAAQFYQEQLGFEVVFTMGEPVSYAIVKRGDATVHILRGPSQINGAVKPNATDLYFFVTDASALCEDLRGRGAEIAVEPTDTEYQMREFVVRDGSGYLLAFGQDLSAG